MLIIQMNKKPNPRDNYGPRQYRRVIETDRMYMDRLLVVDYRLLYSINQELSHITFLGPLIDRTEELNGYRTVILVRSDSEKEKALERIENLCFKAEVMTVEDIVALRPYASCSAIITTRTRYQVLKETPLVGNYYVLQ